LRVNLHGLVQYGKRFFFFLGRYKDVVLFFSRQECKFAPFISDRAYFLKLVHCLRGDAKDLWVMMILEKHI